MYLVIGIVIGIVLGHFVPEIYTWAADKLRGL